MNQIATPGPDSSRIAASTIARFRRRVGRSRTRSTVQIRSAAKARPGQYVTERVELSDSGMPSRFRRVAIIGVYLLLLIAAVEAISALLAMAGMVSYRCLDSDYCLAAERIANLGINVALIALMAAVIAFGWKGRLFGARRA